MIPPIFVSQETHLNLWDDPLDILAKINFPYEDAHHIKWNIFYSMFSVDTELARNR